MTQFGLLMFATDYAVGPQTLAQQAEMFGSVVILPGTHIPAGKSWPGGKGYPKILAYL